MSETFRCGDNPELVAYLYDDCEPGQREAIAAHLTQCAACAAELASLRATRQQLATWRPPDVALGFRVTRSDAADETPVLPFAARSAPPEAPQCLPERLDGVPQRLPERLDGAPYGGARWWQRPLPAWAQVAAAVAIFASGIALGAARTGAQPPSARVASSAVPTESNRGRGVFAPASQSSAPASSAIQPVAAVTARDLESLEQRLREEFVALKGQLTQAKGTEKSTGARDEEQALLRRVQMLIKESEERQRAEAGLRVAAMAHQLDVKRQMDLAQVQGSMGQMQRSMGQLQTLTATEARDQREAVQYLLRVSQQR